MKLKEGKNNHTYVVEKIEIELNLERRLEALGLTEGSRITILNNDTLGRRIADNIFVKEEAA